MLLAQRFPGKDGAILAGDGVPLSSTFLVVVRGALAALRTVRGIQPFFRIAPESLAAVDRPDLAGLRPGGALIRRAPYRRFVHVFRGTRM